MTPNLFIAARSLFAPHKWFKRSQRATSFRTVEHWEEPLPGTYRYIVGKGWFLVALDSQEGRPITPRPVTYSKALDRFMFKDEHDQRTRYATVTDEVGRSQNLGFFKLDNEIAWIVCWDEDRRFIPGPYKMFCIDKTSGKFREMLRSDDPDYQTRHHNAQLSDDSSARTWSRSPNTLEQSPPANRTAIDHISSSANISSLPSTRRSSLSLCSRRESEWTAVTSPCSSVENFVDKSTPA